jgi:hypothetical protein
VATGADSAPITVVRLLRSRNRCLERFLALCEAYLAALDGGGGLEGLAELQRERESLLRAADLFDRKVSELVPEVAPGGLSAAEREAARAELERKDELVRRILDADLRLISRIEAEKNELLRGIAGARKGAEAISRYKSEWIPEAGEELDAKL